MRLAFRLDLFTYLIIISKRINKCFSNFNPTHVADELNQSAEWDVDIWSVFIEGVTG